MDKRYITTPIYYVNGVPHIGHAYTTFAADILARWHRLHGRDVRFLTGTDENAQKNAEKAEAEKMEPRAFVDKMSATWQQTWDSLGITHDDFIRTTEKRHVHGAIRFWKHVEQQGDIYKGEYEGLYCQGCESYLSERDLADGLCPDHKTAPEKIREENYFFRASKYKDALLAHIEKHPEFVQPDFRRNEVVNYIRDHFEDFSISRPNKGWGIPVPDDPGHVIYVWFDALLNYMTAIGYTDGWEDEGGESRKQWERYWPADLHIIAKDIIKFHCAYWPCMLMSAGLPLPKSVFAHGYFTVDGEKISKSLGNVIDPVELTQEYGIDPVRYFLFREIAFGQDGDFSFARLRERYESDLANGLGNLASRVLAMAAKRKTDGWESPEDSSLKDSAETVWKDLEGHMEVLEFQKALDAIWVLIGHCDKHVEDSKPWELAKTDEERLDIVLAELVEALRHIAWQISPFMPETADKLFAALGLDKYRGLSLEEAKQWGAQDTELSLSKPEPLFPRLESKDEDAS